MCEAETLRDNGSPAPLRQGDPQRRADSLSSAHPDAFLLPRWVFPPLPLKRRMMKLKSNQTRTYDGDGYKKRAACLCFRNETEEEVGEEPSG